MGKRKDERYGETRSKRSKGERRPADDMSDSQSLRLLEQIYKCERGEGVYGKMFYIRRAVSFSYD